MGAWALTAPLALIGLGMGACFGTIFDFALGNIHAHETGSATGALNAAQQLSNAAGSAAITTIFFAGAGAASISGMVWSLGVVAVAVFACCALVPLLPRTARPQEH